MAFEEFRFPDEIAYGSTSSPGYSTRVKTSAAGYESRNANWSETRLSFDVSTGIKKQPDLNALISIFHAVKAQLIGFRFKDWADFTSRDAYDTPAFDDQEIFGPGTGAETEIQLIKTYTFGTSSTVRTIRKPVLGTVLVGVGPQGSPIELTEGVGFTVDTTTGLITLASPVPVGEYVTAGYEFDVPVRFDADNIPISLEAYRVGTVSISVIEIRQD